MLGLVGLIMLFPTISLAEMDGERNPKDKTPELLQSKAEREKILNDLVTLDKEKDELERDLKSELDGADKKYMQKKIDEIEIKVDEIEKQLHQRDIPQALLEKLIGDQEIFETRLLDSKVLEFVTSIGIDIDSKEIQVGLNQNIVNKTNEDFIIDIIKQLMPKTAWHIVYSDVAESISCNQKKCTPVIGGNQIRVDGNAPCSYGFQAKRGSLWGFITAGHCADGSRNSLVRDFDGNVLGTVYEEKFEWGTSCDCAFIVASPTVVDNKIYIQLNKQQSISPTVTKITQASQQQNDRITKSGQLTGSYQHGIVSAINVSVIDIIYGQYIKHLVRSNIHAGHGDSGGTVFDRDDNGNLYGILITHDVWGRYHAPVDQITAHMRVSPVLN